VSDRSSIEWTDATWSPVTGCTEVSPGCDHCYARTFAERFRGVPGHPYEHGFDLQLRPERINLPLRWKRPRRIFVNSMSDLFHAGIPEAFIAQVWATMAAAPQHTFQCLTKRAERMERLLNAQGYRHAFAKAQDGLAVDLDDDREEHWLSIPGFVGYEASSQGRVRGPKGTLATQLNPVTGRPTVTLWNRGFPQTLPVHVLVLRAHRPGEGEADEACHRNGNKLDNRLANLRWGTRSENQREKVRHGSRGGPAKLDEERVLAVRRARAMGRTQQSIADELGVSRSLISMIESERVWAMPDTPWPLRNVWLGVSVESTAYYSRIRHLQRTPAAVRFLSLEPLLGPLPDLPLEGISWVIVGGESGPGARPMHPDWVRTIRDQCEAAGVAFFLKQWGEWTGQAEHFPPGFPPSGHWRWVTTDGAQHTTLDGCLDEQEQAPIIMARVGKRAAGRVLDGRTWDEYPPLQTPTEVLP
jgi:protein gp37